MKGCLHIYCGDGKGKTTAAVGLAIRGTGAGIPVVFCQLMKGNSSSEVKVLEQTTGITVMHGRENFGFSWTLSDKQKKRAKEVYTQLFCEAVRRVEDLEGKSKEKNIKLIIILDELLSAYNYNMIDRDRVMEWLKNRPEGLEVIITGRDPENEFLEIADYITEMKKIKHPFESGVPARKGIEW